MKSLIVGIVVAGLMTACSLEKNIDQQVEKQVESNLNKKNSEGITIAGKTVRDVEHFCRLVREKYVYYSARKQSWTEACMQAKSEAQTVTTGLASLEVFERMVDALYDPHVSLGTNSSRSPRLTPSGADIWLEIEGKIVRVVGVRASGGADKAGVKVGDIVVSIHGKTPKQAAMVRVRTNLRNISKERMTWAVNAAAAGYRDEARSLVVLRDGEKFTFDLGTPVPTLDLPPVSSRRINSKIGYIRLNNSLGNLNAVAAFDTAVEDLKDVDAWILDLRDTPGGGGTDIAEPIMGRFVNETNEYQQIIETDHKPHNRQVFPRGPWTINGPVIVLVGRWTGSMGEGMAIGFDGMQIGLVIGSQMAGLAGGTNDFSLPMTKTPVKFPTYGLRHVDGTPRYLWMPCIQIVSDLEGSKDIALEKAVAELSK